MRVILLLTLANVFMVFACFSVLYLKKALRWNMRVSFLFLLGTVFFAFKKF